MQPQHFVVQIVVAVLLFHSAVGQGTSSCPPRASIYPCSCSKILDETHISCSDDRQTQPILQSHIDRTFLLLRQVNDPTSPLYLERVEITTRTLTTLNLHSLLETHITFLEITDLGNLTRIRVISNENDDLPSNPPGSLIHAKELEIRGRTLRNSGMEDIFGYFSTNLTVLVLRLDNLTSTKYPVRDADGTIGSEVEFLPGFSRFTELRDLYLGYFTTLSTISGGQFRRNRNLQYIDLSESRGLSLGHDAFLLESPLPPFTDDEYLYIKLMSCNLTNARFNSRGNVSCFLGTKRATALDVSFNQLDILDSSHFRGFLSENPNNHLDASANQINCGDQRTRWLRDGAAEFEVKVAGAHCAGGLPGTTIFNANLTAV